MADADNAHDFQPLSEEVYDTSAMAEEFDFDDAQLAAMMQEAAKLGIDTASAPVLAGTDALETQSSPPSSSSVDPSRSMLANPSPNISTDKLRIPSVYSPAPSDNAGETTTGVGDSGRAVSRDKYSSATKINPVSVPSRADVGTPATAPNSQPKPDLQKQLQTPPQPKIAVAASDSSQQQPPQNQSKNLTRKVTIDANTTKKIAYWPSSKHNTTHQQQHQPNVLSTPGSLRLVPDDYLNVVEPIARKRNGKYEEVPHLLDGFRMLNRAPAEDPEDVYALDISSQQLLYVIEDDMTLFTRLHTLRAGENALPFARLGVLPTLKKLVIPCNGITSLDLEVDGRFTVLETLDMSFNAVDEAAWIVLATLPRLKVLDVTSNGVKGVPAEIRDMGEWRDRVIELVLPNQVAALDARLYAGPVPGVASLPMQQSQMPLGFASHPAGLGVDTSDQRSRGISYTETMQGGRNATMPEHASPTFATAAAAAAAKANTHRVSVSGGGHGDGRAFQAFIERRNSSRRRTTSGDSPTTPITTIIDMGSIMSPLTMNTVAKPSGGVESLVGVSGLLSVIESVRESTNTIRSVTTTTETIPPTSNTSTKPPSRHRHTTNSDKNTVTSPIHQHGLNILVDTGTIAPSVNDHGDGRYHGRKSSMSIGRDSDDGETQPINRTAPSEVNAAELRDRDDEMVGSVGQPRHNVDKHGNPITITITHNNNNNDNSNPFNNNGGTGTHEPIPTTSSLPQPTIGFATLEVLILENNKLGVTGSIDFWITLAELPQLRVLNLNNNGITTLKVLVTDEAISAATALHKASTTTTTSISVPIHSILNINPHILPKHKGFKKLTDLHLVRNRIDTVDDLVGLICLPKLTNVYVEGNRVMTPFVIRRRDGISTVTGVLSKPPIPILPKQTPRHAQTDTRNGMNQGMVSVPVSIDIPHVFAQMYGIRVSDTCFQSRVVSVLEPEMIVVGSGSAAGVIGGIHRVNRHRLRLPTTIPTHKQPYVQNGHHKMSHEVDEVNCGVTKRLIRERRMKRGYVFTDEDLEAIVRCGKIPGVRQLVKMAEERAQGVGGDGDGSETGGGHGGGHTHRRNQRVSGENLGDISPKPDDRQSPVTAPTESDATSTKQEASATEAITAAAAGYEPQLPIRPVTKPRAGGYAESIQSFDTFGESITSSLQEIMYDPNHVDDTFLTGVRITNGDGGRRGRQRYRGGGVGSQSQSRYGAGQRNGDDMGTGTSDDDDDSGSETTDTDSSSYTDATGSTSSSTDDSDSMDSDDSRDIDNGQMDKVYPLPNAIQLSVRALRHALYHPVSYWRIMEESYARPTVASLRRKTAFVTGDQLWNEAASANKAFTSEIRGKRYRSRMSDDGSDVVRGLDMSATGGEPRDRDLDAMSLSNLSTPLMKSYVTPANSVWTPTHGDDPFVLIPDYVPPTEISTKTKIPIGTVMYRQRVDLPLGQKGALFDSEDQRRLQRQLEIKLKQRDMGKVSSLVLSGVHGIAGPNTVIDTSSGNGNTQTVIAAAKRQQNMNKKLVMTAALQRAHLAGRFRPKDEFDELDDLMHVVDTNLKTIETNLNEILKSSRLKERLPQSGKLYDQLKREYARIEHMYLEDAKAVVKTEPLSQRLQKLGIRADGSREDAKV